MRYEADIHFKRENDCQLILIKDGFGPVSGGNRPNLSFYYLTDFIGRGIFYFISEIHAVASITYAQICITYAALTITYAQMTITYAALTITYAQMTITYAALTITYAQMTITYADLTITYAQMTITYATSSKNFVPSNKIVYSRGENPAFFQEKINF